MLVNIISTSNISAEIVNTRTLHCAATWKQTRENHSIALQGRQEDLPHIILTSSKVDKWGLMFIKKPT